MSDDSNESNKKLIQRQHDRDKQKSSTDSTMMTTTTMLTLNAILLLLPHAASMDFSQIVLRYRAEGNANLVLALPQFRKVLRLPKMNSNKTTTTTKTTTAAAAVITSNIITTKQAIATDHDNNTEQKQKQHEPQQLQSTSGVLLLKQHENPKGSAPHPNVLLASANGKLSMADYVGYIDVVRRLLGHEFILKAEIIEIASAEQQNWINESIRPYRPAHRLDKEFCGHYGLLMPDATLLPEEEEEETSVLLSNLQATPSTSGNVYAIEIKPKQGWLLPSPSDVNDLFYMQQPAESTSGVGAACEIGMVKKSTTRCRYCAMQFLKLKENKIATRSSYCPIELFSGQPLRMLAALSSLFECPQNNLRVFENENLIYGDHTTSISWNELKQQVFKGDMLQIVQNLLVKCLLRDYETTATTSTRIPIAATSIPAQVSSAIKSDTIVVEVVAGQPHLTAKNMEPTMKKNKLTMEEMSKTKIELDDIVKYAADRDKTEVEEEEEEEDGDEEHLQKKKPRLKSTAESTSMTLRSKTKVQITDPELLCLPKNCVLHKILHLQLLAKHNLRYMSTTELANETTKCYHTLRTLLAVPAAEVNFEQLTPTQQYLLGATAMDCSIMITFQELKTDEGHSLSGDTHIVDLTEFNKKFLTKVTILDLDPKPDSHFWKYIKHTQQAYQCYEKSLHKEI